MSVASNTRLFFFKANPYDLKAVEAYLTKRGYEVISESDSQQAIVKIMQFEPAFVFIAWDHPNPTILEIAKFISQSIATIIVPYVQSSSREQIIKLENSGHALKIYPPVSGPAVIRAVLKIEKENRVMDELKKGPKERVSEMTFLAGTKRASSDEVNKFLQKVSQSQKFSARKSKSGAGNQPVSRGAELKHNNARLASFDASLATEKLKPDIKASLQDDFSSTVRDQLAEIAQTNDAEEPSSETTRSQIGYFKKILCLIVESEKWCGYLLIASQTNVQQSDYQAILQNWLRNQFIDMEDINESDYFAVDFHDKEVDLKSWANLYSDYLELVQIDNNEIMVSFFSIDPKYLIMEVSDSNDMLEVSLEIVPTDDKVTLSLFLHLPDNKKFILYTPAKQVLSSQQKTKLLDKRVEKMFTPVEFEKELNILKAEYFLNESVKMIKGVSS